MAQIRKICAIFLALMMIISVTVISVTAATGGEGELSTDRTTIIIHARQGRITALRLFMEFTADQLRDVAVISG